MEINETTAASLGEKLANLELSNEEGALLSALLAPEDEVSGFSKQDDPGAYAMHKVKKFAPSVFGPVDKNWSWGASQSTQWSWGISQDV